jgi:hypothetical protein
LLSIDTCTTALQHQSHQASFGSTIQAAKIRSAHFSSRQQADHGLFGHLDANVIPIRHQSHLFYLPDLSRFLRLGAAATLAEPTTEMAFFIGALLKSATFRGDGSTLFTLYKQSIRRHPPHSKSTLEGATPKGT